MQSLESSVIVCFECIISVLVLRGAVLEVIIMFDARCLHFAGFLQSQCSAEKVGVPRIRFVFKSLIITAQDPIEHADPFAVTWTLAKPASQFEVKAFAEFALMNVERAASAKCGEVVAMYNFLDVQNGIVESTWRRTSL